MIFRSLRQDLSSSLRHMGPFTLVVRLCSLYLLTNCKFTTDSLLLTLQPDVKNFSKSRTSLRLWVDTSAFDAFSYFRKHRARPGKVRHGGIDEGRRTAEQVDEGSEEDASTEEEPKDQILTPNYWPNAQQKANVWQQEEACCQRHPGVL